MAYEVLRVASVARTVEGLDKARAPRLRRGRASAARRGLPGGRQAPDGERRRRVSALSARAIRRLADDDGLPGGWEHRDRRLAKHTENDEPAATLAEIFPGLSAKGRRRSEQPPCCENPTAPPTMSPELERILFDVFDV